MGIETGGYTPLSASEPKEEPGQLPDIREIADPARRVLEQIPGALPPEQQPPTAPPAEKTPVKDPPEREKEVGGRIY